MPLLAKEGFLLMRKLANSKSHLTPQVAWKRRWFVLYSDGTLKCYDTCYAKQLEFSLHVSADDLVYPDGMSGKPWIISVRAEERGEKLLLEADCEECMERWAELMKRPSIGNKLTLGLKPTLSPKPKLQPFRFDHDLPNTRSRNRSATDPNQSPVENSISHPLSNQSSPTHNQEDPWRCQISTNTFDEIVRKKNDPGLTYSDYINVNELRDVLVNSFSKNIQSPIMKTKERSITSISPPEKLVNAATRNKFNPNFPLPIQIIQPKKEYIEFGSIFPQASVGQKPLQSNERNFKNSLPKYQQLLNDYWVMFFLLPNGKVYKQLINLTIPIQTSLQPLLKCFDYTLTSPDAYLTLQVIGDLYQTYNTEKSSRTVKKKKKIMSLGWKMPFSSQGVVTSKIVRIKLREDTTARLNSDRLNEFLFGINHTSESELFCMSWVSFVKGNFPVLDPPISAFYSACIFLIYRLTQDDLEDIDVNTFVPSHLKKVVSHTNTIKEEIRMMKYSDPISINRLFLDNLNASRSGNGISLPITRLIKASTKLKNIDCIFVIGKYHIGITRIENESTFTKADAISEFWHFSKILGWFIQPEDGIVFIQLKSDIDSCDDLVFFSHNVHFVDFIFCQYLGAKKM